VRKLIQRMLVFGFVSFKQIGGHNLRHWALVFGLRSSVLGLSLCEDQVKDQRPKAQDSIHNIYEYIHSSTTNHSFFACLGGGE
jgi:predicted P-loop ATPase/GTPase